MAEPMLRIAALYERDECRQINGSWCIPMSALGKVLEGSGYRIVTAHVAVPAPAPPKREQRREQRREPERAGCGCATLDDCQRRGCGQTRSCRCATLDDCLRRGCR